MLASACNSTARPSRLTPRSLTLWTLPTVASLASSRPTAARSAAVSAPPEARATTTGTGVWSIPWNGAAIRAACRLGLLAGRNPVLSCLATLVRDGRNTVARTAAATQATTMTQRNRTANRPRAA